MLQVFEILPVLDIVHVDLKPDNLLFDFDGEKIKDLNIIDFGSAVIYSEATTVNMGTPEYLSPEVLKFIYQRYAEGSEEAWLLFSKMKSWSFDI